VARRRSSTLLVSLIATDMKTAGAVKDEPSDSHSDSDDAQEDGAESRASSYQRAYVYFAAKYTHIVCALCNIAASAPNPLGACWEKAYGGLRPWGSYKKVPLEDGQIENRPHKKKCKICYNVWRSLGSPVLEYYFGVC